MAASRVLLWNALGLICAYAILISMKWNGFTVPNVTWLDVLAGPLVIFSTLASTFILPYRFPRHVVLCIALPSFLATFVLGLVMWFERGW